jgi:hypothetical protein
VGPVPAGVPKRAADTVETAQRQRLAATAKASSPDRELLVYRSREEGGALIPRQDRVARGVRNLPKAAAASTGALTTDDWGVRNLPKAIIATTEATTTAASGVRIIQKGTTTPTIAPPVPTARTAVPKVSAGKATVPKAAVSLQGWHSGPSPSGASSSGLIRDQALADAGGWPISAGNRMRRVRKLRLLPNRLQSRLIPFLFIR